MYQQYLYPVIIIILVVGYLCIATPLIEWLRLHLHRKSTYLLVDEEEAFDVIDRFGYALTEQHAASPFTTNPDALVVMYNDRFGRTAVHKVRWMNKHYYYVNQHWLDYLDVVWPVDNEAS